MNINALPRQNIFRLTVLWAFSESGLGGIMHALKIPFTGFFVGGFAIIIIGLIAFFSEENKNRKAVTKSILQATFLVCLAKAAISPQSPIGAYIAVAFQGLLGSVLFRLLPFKLAAPLFGTVALLESAFQKLLMLTILFGKSIWHAFDIFMDGLLKDLAIDSGYSYTFWLILVYALVYALWGFILGFWIGKLPSEIQLKKIHVLKDYTTFYKKSIIKVNNDHRNPKKLIFIFLTLFILLIIAFFFNQTNEVLFVLARTILVLFCLMFVLQPLLSWFLRRYILMRSKHKPLVEQIISILPEINSLVKPAYQMASHNYTGINRYRNFIVNMLVLSIYLQNDHD